MESFDLPVGGLVKIATEVKENKDAVKTNYNKIELLNKVLVQKLILVDRVSKVDDREKAMDDLSGVLETYLGECNMLEVNQFTDQVYW